MLQIRGFLLENLQQIELSAYFVDVEDFLFRLELIHYYLLYPLNQRKTTSPLG